MTQRMSILFLWVGFGLLGGCHERELTDGVPPDAGCDVCHRSAENPTPVLETDAGIPPVVPEDGHLLHTQQGVGCEVCHPVAVHVAAPSHIDAAPAEVAFSGWAVDGAAAPVWNPTTKTCQGTYCHGGASGGGTKSVPVWTAPQVGSLCTDCHGSPPQTGAHVRHVTDKNIACAACHTIPIEVGQAGHLDRYPAEVVLGPDASKGQTTPVYEVATKRCVNTYCHGATMIGGTNIAPVWQPPAGEAAACDSCHGNPPLDDSHIGTEATCYICHMETLTDQDTINDELGFHINGQPDSK